MGRLTKLEIQHDLLAGREIAWTNAAGKRESIALGDAAQRRLFACLLQSDVREAKGLPDQFVADLSKVCSGKKEARYHRQPKEITRVLTQCEPAMEQAKTR